MYAPLTHCEKAGTSARYALQSLAGLCRQLIKFLSTEARRAGVLREKLEKVEVWTQQRRIPSSLTRRIRAYYAEIWLDYAGALLRRHSDSRSNIPGLSPAERLPASHES